MSPGPAVPQDSSRPQQTTGVTLRHIAQKTGVSHSTVSRALRNHPGLPKATCSKIQKIAAQMGYRTNPLVSTLTSQLRMSRAIPYQATLAFVTSYETHDAWRIGRPAFLRFFNGARNRAHGLGYEVDEFWITEPGMNRQRIQKILRARNIRGLLIAPMPRPQGRLSLDWSRYAAATIGYTMAAPHIDSSRNHHNHAINLCIRKLTQSGHRRIGLALRPQSYKFSDDIFASRYLYHVHVTGQTPLPLFCLGGAHEDFNEEAFGLWLKQHRPDAVICMGEDIHNWCDHLKIPVPGELSLVDLDIHDFSKNWSGIDGQEEEVSAAAVDLVIQRLQQNTPGIPSCPKAIHVEGRWLEGSTIANRKPR